MTAEDLLCDSCREGCNMVFILPHDVTNNIGTHLRGQVDYGPMHWPDGGTAV
jgi:hypothetical protein